MAKTASSAGIVCGDSYQKNSETVARALQRAAALGLPRLDAQLLLLHALGHAGQDRAWLIAHDGDCLQPAQLAAYLGLCARRAAGEPVAYIVGEKEFFGLPLQVDARVLVPRPDTETLVEWALDVLRGLDAPSVLDLGTGSGAIALAIQSRRPDARVQAVDASADALDVARANAARLGLPVRFLRGSWFDGHMGRHDLIVANPPYVAEGDPHLAALTHEPRMALTAGPDGLGDIRAIVAQAGRHLAPHGWLLLEHGWNQAMEAQQLLLRQGFAAVQSRSDLAGIARCTGGRWPAVK
ncbi:peptide chain release factor N(5)-glutamine methyltransferase [Ramlibacter sp. H39-3-26]|uniref:peptide chain release factor N(5)-glutamine methyltransferase n=1 Tax=Curvibacter soli TaxID=3031331 RepID=UPI0023DC8A32|nr:peptide chain release factor N(5)-glutamine methyltransferase [Ramlibacter sp. H39-3-26]MDF1485902.1 peptide chain release factor N(5)-glutamine methyltransferase [Ramlibacter sp. H39-3-26]